MFAKDKWALDQMCKVDIFVLNDYQFDTQACLDNDCFFAFKTCEENGDCSKFLGKHLIKRDDEPSLADVSEVGADAAALFTCFTSECQATEAYDDDDAMRARCMTLLSPPPRPHAKRLALVLR